MKNPTIVFPTAPQSLQVSTLYMRPLPSEEINPETESAMKESVGKYRPLRQRTVREETNKGKTGALPPAVSAHEATRFHQSKLVDGTRERL